MRARIFERGVGETLSSGTGASGAAVAAVLGGAASPIAVKLDGGELAVEVGEDLDVLLTGTAEPVSGRALAGARRRPGTAHSQGASRALTLRLPMATSDTAKRP